MTQAKDEIAFIFCYARSGGTFLNRFLANVDNLVVLSEAHPVSNLRTRAPMSTIAEQAEKWYGIKVQSSEYLEQILEIKNWCVQNNKYLLVRDWSYIDFAENGLNNYNPPGFSTNRKLFESRFTVKKIAFVRDAIDVCLSRGKKIEIFAKEYLRFVKYIMSLDIPIYKYEDFCENPLGIYNEMAESMNLPALDSLRSGMFSSKKVIGDVNFSRGNVKNTIAILDRRYVSPLKRNKINNNMELGESNRLLGYNDRYESRKRESLFNHIKFKAISRVKKVKKYIDNVSHAARKK